MASRYNLRQRKNNPVEAYKKSPKNKPKNNRLKKKTIQKSIQNKSIIDNDNIQLPAELKQEIKVVEHPDKKEIDVIRQFVEENRDKKKRELQDKINVENELNQNKVNTRILNISDKENNFSSGIASIQLQIPNINKNELVSSSIVSELYPLFAPAMIGNTASGILKIGVNVGKSYLNHRKNKIEQEDRAYNDFIMKSNSRSAVDVALDEMQKHSLVIYIIFNI
jgi:hypothetical protein